MTSKYSSNPWNQKKISNKTNKKAQKPTLRYKCFEDCAELNDDPFWKEIFINAAYDKLPKAYSIKDDMIIYRRGKSIHTESINKNTMDLMHSFIKFMKDTSGLESSLEKERREALLNERMVGEKSFIEYKWSDVKKKIVKDMLILDFVHRTSKEKGFNNQVQKELHHLIKLGFLMGQLTHHDIVFEKGIITKINNLDIDNMKLLNTSKHKNIKINIEKINLYKKITHMKSISLLKEWKTLLDSYPGYKKSQIIVNSSIDDFSADGTETKDSESTTDL